MSATDSPTTPPPHAPAAAARQGHVALIAMTLRYADAHATLPDSEYLQWLAEQFADALQHSTTAFDRKRLTDTTNSARPLGANPTSTP